MTYNKQFANVHQPRATPLNSTELNLSHLVLIYIYIYNFPIEDNLIVFNQEKYM